MIVFDTNMILRYLLNDNEQMAEQAENYLNRGHVTVTVEVLAEVVYVLEGVYAMKRKQIADTMKGFLELVACEEADSVNLAFDIFGQRKLDFVDCVLYGYHMIHNAEIATFDKKLLKLLMNS